MSLLVIGCATSKSFQKKGVKLEEAGLVEEAANMYLISLQKNRANVDAKIGLKNTGQAVLNRMLNEFGQEKVFGNKRAAIQKYAEAMNYHKKVANLGVQLNIPSLYVDDYAKIKDEYLNELYDEGLELMDQQRFNEAEEKFVEIKRLDPNFEDAHELADVAYVEPLYAEGLKNFEAQRYRSAYDAFTKVANRLVHYKDVENKKEEALTLGRFTLAMLPFENSTRTGGLDIRITAYSLEALTSVNDPFLKIVDRENMQLILEEQKLGLSGVLDEETAVSVGELIGAQAIVSGAILSYGENIGRPERRTAEGYERYRVKRLNKENNKYYYETKYRKTTYDTYVNRNVVTASFQYKVISLKTGEILASRIIERDVQDRVEYASYSGELDQLFPSSGNGVNTNRRAKQSLDRLFTARQTPKGADELGNQIFQELSQEMKRDIQNLMKELVQ